MKPYENAESLKNGGISEQWQMCEEELWRHSYCQRRGFMWFSFWEKCQKCLVSVTITLLSPKLLLRSGNMTSCWHFSEISWLFSWHFGADIDEALRIKHDYVVHPWFCVYNPVKYLNIFQFWTWIWVNYYLWLDAHLVYFPLLALAWHVYGSLIWLVKVSQW